MGKQKFLFFILKKKRVRNHNCKETHTKTQNQKSTQWSKKSILNQIEREQTSPNTHLAWKN